MNNKAQSRLTKFRQQIRRTQIQKIKSEFRKYSELDLTTTNQVAALMKLPPKPEPQKYTFYEMMSLAESSLLKPPLSPSAIQEESNSSPMSMQAHIRFWKLYSQHLNQNPQQNTEQAVNILLLIIEKYTYENIHYNTMYELHLLNTLELVCPTLADHYKDKVLDWVAGTQGLRVIEACLPKNTFLIYRNYVRVYRVLQLGLKSELKSESVYAAKILTKILKNADWDETFTLYQNAQGLMTYLCSKVQRYCQKEETEVYNIAIMFLIDSFDQAIIDYARTGLAYIAGLLITSSIDSNRSEGLQILRIMSQTHHRKIATQLLYNKDVIRTRMWEHLLTTQNFSTSKNITIRKNYFSVLQSLMANGQKQDVQLLCSMFADRYEDVLDMLVQCLQNEDEVFILLSAVGCLSSLMYIAKQNSLVKHLEQAFQHKGIIKALQNLSKHTNNQLCSKIADIFKLMGCQTEEEMII